MAEQISDVIHVNHGFIWCWNLGPETTGKFWDVMLEMGEEQTDRVKNEV